MRKCVGRGEGKARDSGFAFLKRRDKVWGFRKKILIFWKKSPTISLSKKSGSGSESMFPNLQQPSKTRFSACTGISEFRKERKLK